MRTVAVTIAIACVFGAAAVHAEPVRGAYPSANVQFLPAFVALEKGFYKREGLDPELISVRSAVTAVQALLGNQIHFIFSVGPQMPSVWEGADIILLAQMIGQKQVREDTPVRELLPKGTVVKPAGAEITLLDLVTQHSGLPRLPDNMRPADPNNPYADYRAADLYQFIGRHGVQKPGKPEFLYSNLGLGFLGQALANRADTSYPELLKRVVLEPLELRDTTIALTAEQQRRFIAGYSAALQPAHAWDLDALAGAGAIRSTAGDMLEYLEANLHPRTLSAAFARSHELRADVGPGTRIAYAWLCNTASGDYWHNGATGGYSSYALFSPQGEYAVIVLVNVTISSRGSFADRLGEHISQRLSGKPAVSLENW